MKTITGKLIQAGDNQHEDGLPTLTFQVSREQLAQWGRAWPFYRYSLITIEDAAQPDPIADQPQLF